ncbi:hypothetical protein AVEN_210132-1 [Araneus ventricosus]|uniref:Uncharacterized protein n=1 Tax=Araneus ventricosus TaxID=182803 RepID=A0A4Y2MKY5_ARAVE|nr:hypothetical protein AVEN_210132-1 [Araneus ventricosus]
MPTVDAKAVRSHTVIARCSFKPNCLSKRERIVPVGWQVYVDQKMEYAGGVFLFAFPKLDGSSAYFMEGRHEGRADRSWLLELHN